MTPEECESRLCAMLPESLGPIYVEAYECCRARNCGRSSVGRFTIGAGSLGTFDSLVSLRDCFNKVEDAHAHTKGAESEAT